MSKILRIFRILRPVRLARLIRYFYVIKGWLLGRPVALLLADHLKSITILRAFVRAHCEAHYWFIQFFGNDGIVDLAEEAHCLLDSQQSTYLATYICAHLVRRMDPAIISGLDILLDTASVAKEIEEFINRAFEAGILN